MIEDDLELAEVLSLYLKQFNIEVVNFEEPFLALSRKKKTKNNSKGEKNRNR